MDMLPSPSVPGVTTGASDSADGRRHRAPSKVSYRQHAAIGLLFALFAVVELWTPIAHGGYFSPTDIGQLWAVTRTAAGPPSPKNALQSDVYVDFDPFLHYDVAQVTSGHFPSWNPYNGNGQPFFADDQTIVLSPFTLPFYVLGFKLALIAAALARLWLRVAAGKTCKVNDPKALWTSPREQERR